MDKLIIANCAADTSMHPGVPQRLGDSAALGAEVEAAWRAGAAIVHIHAPPDDFSAWANHTAAIRERCDILVQYGISTQNVAQRRAVIKNNPEMISVSLGAHNLVNVRVGTEDEPHLRPGVLGTNADHVARIVRIATEFGRAIASVAEARAMLQLSRG